MKKLCRLLSLLLFLCLLSGTFAACQSNTTISDGENSLSPASTGNNAGSTPEELVTVKIGMIPYAAYAMWAVAKDLGIDQDFGLNFEFYDFAGSAQGYQACVRGDIDLAPGSIEEHLTAISGAPNLISGLFINHFQGFFFVGHDGDLEAWETFKEGKTLEEAKEERIEQFRGRSFCIIPQRKAFIMDTLAQVGLTDEDVTFINFADDQKAATAFMSGTGDFYIGSLPQQLALIKDPQYINVGGSEILGPAGLFYGNMCVRQDYMENNRDTVMKLMAVWFATVNVFDGDPAKCADIACKYLTKTTGVEFSEDEWIMMETQYDNLTSLDDAKEIFFNPDSPGYWSNSIDYQIEIQTAEGRLEPGITGEQYFGDSEALFNDLLEDLELISKIDSYK